MCDGVESLTLPLVNEATQAWAELDYHRNRHSELDATPLARYLDGPDVARPSPSSEVLRQAFRQQTVRTQRRSDGTVSLAGRRFELPSRYRTLKRVTLRNARWDLRSVDLIDPDTEAVLCAIYPLDKSANASARRRVLETPNISPVTPTTMAPLLTQLLADYAATGLPPAYLPLECDDE
jgi:hypothetical protein